MRHKHLRLYSALSRWSPLKGYQGKIMLVAFLGTHIPLLALLAYFVIITSLSTEVMVRVGAIAAVATLAGAGTTLYALHALLVPISMTYTSLRQYLSDNVLPRLPTHFEDEVGMLMADTQQTVMQLDHVITYMATYDSLTGLPNRVLFRDRVVQSIAESKRKPQELAVVLLDLDNFKEVNNALGNDAGDLLIRQVVERLLGCIREVDVLGRIGSHEFVILHTHVREALNIMAQVTRILTELDKPFISEGREIYLSTSMGISVYPHDGENADALMRSADAALQQAQRRGMHNYQFYAPELNVTLQRRVTLENDLRGAVARDELAVYYQPQIELATGRIVGAEALLRWHHPELGMISPSEFIPVAESSELIIPIGAWVLRKACEQSRAWRDAGLAPVRVAVNLSARQCRQPSLPQQVRDVLADVGLEPELLELEITESVVMDDLEQATEILLGLRSQGVTIALDDFGTGYSSLNYLKNLPIDVVKIDQSFVRDIGTSASNEAIARAIIALADSLKLSVIAEGIETDAQAAFLLACHCEMAQGFLFGRPVPAEQMTTLLTSAMAMADLSPIQYSFV
ncbi:MAG: hypothetical protein NVSMB42_08470 [Herpetosiphon sp.]